MAHSFHHAQSSAKRFGGKPEDYLAVHDWFDGTKELEPTFRHRALRHHTHGIFEAERIFGHTITNSDGKQVPVRIIGEQHVKEDFSGFIPTVHDWLKGIPFETWMQPEPGHQRKLMKSIEI
jgi:hypothetical protein